MTLRSTWILWLAVASIACGRTSALGPFGDDEASGGGAALGGTGATGGANSAVGGTVTGGVGATSGTGATGGSTRGGSAGAASGAESGGSSGVAGSGAGSGGRPTVLGCDVPIRPPAGPCERFEAVGETYVEGESSLSLVPVQRDGSCISVVTWRARGHAFELAALTFMPWQNWPSRHPLGPLTKIPLPAEPSSRFTVSPSDDGPLALAWQKLDGVISFGWDIDPETFEGTYRDIDQADRSLASSTSTFGQLVLVGGMWGLSSRTYARPPMSGYANHPGTCADGDVSADVEPFDDGFLIAASTGDANTQSHGCPNYPDLGGPPTRIWVSNIPSICCGYPVAQWEAGGVVTRLRTAPHPAGIWVVWRTDAANGPMLWWSRIERDDPTRVHSGRIGAPFNAPGVFDTVVFGDRLAIVWADSLDGNHRLRVMLISDDDILTDFSPELALPADLENISVVAGPDGTGLVVGFGGGQLRRLDCRPWF